LPSRYHSHKASHSNFSPKVGPLEQQNQVSSSDILTPKTNPQNQILCH